MTPAELAEIRALCEQSAPSVATSRRLSSLVPRLVDALEAAQRERDAARMQLDCASAGCGTDERYACRRCCRIMLANYAANHGTRCDAEQERLLANGQRACEQRDAALARATAAERDAEETASEHTRERDALRAKLAAFERVVEAAKGWAAGRVEPGYRTKDDARDDMVPSELRLFDAVDALTGKDASK